MIRYRAKAISGAGLSLPLKLRIGSASSKTHPPSRRRCRCGSCQQRSCCSNRHRYYALLGCERYAGSMRRTTAHCRQRSCAARCSTIDPTREAKFDSGGSHRCLTSPDTVYPCRHYNPLTRPFAQSGCPPGSIQSWSTNQSTILSGSTSIDHGRSGKRFLSYWPLPLFAPPMPVPRSSMMLPDAHYPQRVRTDVPNKTWTLLNS